MIKFEINEGKAECKTSGDWNQVGNEAVLSVNVLYRALKQRDQNLAEFFVQKLTAWVQDGEIFDDNFDFKKLYLPAYIRYSEGDDD